MENFRPTEKSTCVRPKPGISFRPSVPCRIGEGIENASGLRDFPPPALAFEIQTGCPGTKSGRERATPPGSGEAEATTALKGTPVRITPTMSMNQSFVKRAIGPDLTAVGIA